MLSDFWHKNRKTSWCFASITVSTENDNDEFGMILFSIVGRVWVKKENHTISIEIGYLCKFGGFRHRGTCDEFANMGVNDRMV